VTLPRPPSAYLWPRLAGGGHCLFGRARPSPPAVASSGRPPPRRSRPV